MPVTRSHWLLLLAVVIALSADCRSAEPFNSGQGSGLKSDVDAADQSGSGGIAARSGGSGGDESGSGGASSGSGGAGGMVNQGSGGDSGTGGASPSSGGSDGAVQAEVSVDATPTDDADHVEARPDVGANFCLNSKWTASASASANVAPPPAGIDGNLTTRWGNGRFQDGTDWFKVDFGGSVRIDSITLDNSMAYPGDYPGAYAVYGSQDGTTFTGPFATGNGTNNTTVIRFTGQTVRAIKINQTGTSRQTNWWQVGELRINCLP